MSGKRLRCLMSAATLPAGEKSEAVAVYRRQTFHTRKVFGRTAIVRISKQLPDARLDLGFAKRYRSGLSQLA